MFFTEMERPIKKSRRDDSSAGDVNGETAVELLQRQLEEARREAELFKAKLVKKEEEASEYKRKLSQLAGSPEDS